MKKAELLSPAGAMPQLKAAIDYGADAVYCGAKKFGLRAYAGNFDAEALSEAASYAHKRGVKLYVTFNAFLYDDNMEDAAKTMEMIGKSGADAAIVSDIAAILLAKEHAPNLPIHASTQANTLNSLSARHWYELGASRIILARELSLERISSMREKLPEDLELEAFVHGAMCASYSGRCVLSNHLSGRDANQGGCVQPCRWKYALVEEKRPGKYLPIAEDENGTYIYSANDLCMIEHVPELLKAGISSLKIEGRMKTEYYVATVTGAYRRAMDNFYADPEAPFDKTLLDEIMRASHRPLSTGFYYGKPDSPPGTAEYKQDSVFVANVISYDSENKRVHVRQRNKFLNGEMLTRLSPEGTVSFKVEELRDDEGKTVESAPHPMQRLSFKCDIPMNEGDFIRRDLDKS